MKQAEENNLESKLQKFKVTKKILTTTSMYYGIQVTMSETSRQSVTKACH